MALVGAAAHGAGYALGKAHKFVCFVEGTEVAAESSRCLYAGYGYESPLAGFSYQDA